MSISLRPYQSDLVTRIYNGWSSGSRNVMAVLPTGGGKSLVVSEIALNAYRQNTALAVIAHRKELVSQMSGHLARRGIRHRLIASTSTISQITGEHRAEFGKSLINPDAACAVVSVDTLVKRATKLVNWLPQVGMWITDECHHLIGNDRVALNKWGKAAAMFPNAYGLGVTATPCRADGNGLGHHADGLFDEMILGPSMRDLIDMGNLCDYQLALPLSDFTISDDAVTPTGDYSPTAMREASKKSHIVGDVVSEYVKHALFKRAICFATDVETANEISAKFNASGITAMSLSAETPPDVRAEYIRRFRDGKTFVLVNVDLFSEGFDCPACEVVIMARPTASLGVFLQQAGRALRPSPSKLYGLIIDHVGNVKRHGLPDKDHYWTLDRRDKRGKSNDPENIPMASCKSCSKPYERFFTVCPHCGAEPPLPAPGGRTIELVDGDLVLLDAAMLAAMRAATVLDSPADIAARVAMAAGSIAGTGAANKQIARIQMQQRLNEALCQWAGRGRALGRSDRELDKRLYLALGIDKHTALALPRADMEKLAITVEGWL